MKIQVYLKINLATASSYRHYCGSILIAHITTLLSIEINVNLFLRHGRLCEWPGGYVSLLLNIRGFAELQLFKSFNISKC